MRGRREDELTSRSSMENGLGATIRAWRRFRGLTVTDLAVQAGFGQNGRGYISRIEHGLIQHLGEERLERIAIVLQVQCSDLLLHQMPDSSEEVLASDLEEAIIGGKALLKVYREKSFDWARIQLLLAKLYKEFAMAAHTAIVKHTTLVEAHQCIESSLLVFNADKTPQSFQQAIQLGQEIDVLLDASIITGSVALSKRCPPQSSDWARVQLHLAKLYHEHAAVLQGLAARTTLVQAQQCIEAALSVFAQKQARGLLKEAQQLYEEITQSIQQPLDILYAHQ